MVSIESMGEKSSALLLPVQEQKVMLLLARWHIGLRGSSGTRSETKERNECVVGQIKQVQLGLPP